MKKPLNIFKLVIGSILLLFFLFVFLNVSLRSLLNTPVSQLILALVYGLGVACQIVLTLEGSAFSKKMLFAVLISLVGFLPGKHETVYIFSEHIFIYLVCWTIMVSFLFRKEILPRINERSVLQIFLIAAYLIFEAIRSAGGQRLPFPVFCIAFLLVIVFPFLAHIIFSNHIAGPRMKAYLYIWFLAISLLILIIQTGDFGLYIFYGKAGLLSLNSQMLSVALFNGMVLFPVLTNAAYLLELLPLPGKHQTFKNRLQEVKDELEDMIVHYAPDRLSILESLLVILIQGGFLFANYYLGFISPSLAILISFACVEVVVHLKLDYWYELRGMLSNTAQ